MTNIRAEFPSLEEFMSLPDEKKIEATQYMLLRGASDLVGSALWVGERTGQELDTQEINRILNEISKAWEQAESMGEYMKHLKEGGLVS